MTDTDEAAHAPEQGPRTSTAPDETRCVRTAAIRGVLLALAPGVVVLAPRATLGLPDPVLRWVPAALLVLGGLFHRAGSAVGATLGTIGLTGWVAGALLRSLDNPVRGLIILLLWIGTLAYIWPSERLRVLDRVRGTIHPDRAVAAATIAAAVIGIGSWELPKGATPVEHVATSVLYLFPIGWALFEGRFRRAWEAVALVLAAGLGLIPMTHALGTPIATPALGALSLGVLALVLTGRAIGRAQDKGSAQRTPGLIDTILLRPSRVLVISFAAISAVGALLLRLPVATADEKAIAPLDAVFTAVSATCVTGLIVVDTPHAFGGVGQAIVLVLIQVGGLGIMVFSAAAITLLGRRLSLSHERAAVDIVGALGRADLTKAVRAVLLMTVATEVIAALLLSIAFALDGDPLGMAIWRGAFTAISAFCNAGFALQSDSLVGYADNGFVMTVVALAIIIGGLGPAVVGALASRGKLSHRSLHVRLVVAATVVLLVAPAILITAIEWDHTLGGMPWYERLLNGGFQSVTLRTAGFNSIDITRVEPATRSLMLALMFVGGSPGSTAGGVKTTTAAVVLLAVASVVRGRDRVEVYGRTLPPSTVMRAFAVATVGVLAAGVALVPLQLTQTLSLDVALFEVVSALGTVGLSAGGTGALDEIGKLIIIACMFAGRVGPLSLFVFLVSQSQQPPATRRHPEETVPIG